MNNETKWSVLGGEINMLIGTNWFNSNDKLCSSLKFVSNDYLDELF